MSTTQSFPSFDPNTAIRGHSQRGTRISAGEHGRFGSGVNFSFNEMDTFAKECRQLAKMGLNPTSIGQQALIKVFGDIGKEVRKMSAQSAPRSGQTGLSEWSKNYELAYDGPRTRDREPGQFTKYYYVGKHGDISKQLTYLVSPWRKGRGRGRGVHVRLGGRPKNEMAANAQRILLAGLVGKFAKVRAKRQPGYTAKTGPNRTWMEDAMSRVMKKRSPDIVNTYSAAMIDEINKSIRRKIRRAQRDAAAKAGGK